MLSLHLCTGNDIEAEMFLFLEDITCFVIPKHSGCWTQSKFRSMYL